MLVESIYPLKAWLMRIRYLPLFFWVVILGTKPSCAFALEDSGSYEVVYDAITNAIEENRTRFNAGKLVWSREVLNDGFGSSPAPAFTTSGLFLNWVKDGKTATSSKYETYVRNPRPGESPFGTIGFRSADNGEDFRVIDDSEGANDIAILAEPDYRQDQLYFDAFEWPYSKRLAIYSPERLAASGGYAVQTEIIPPDGGIGPIAVIKLSHASEGSMIMKFDMGKGGNFLEQETRDLTGTLLTATRVEYSNFNGGVWAPVRYHFSAFHGDGKIILDRKLEVDLKETKINDVGSIPDEVFNIELTPGIQVSDYRSGARLEYTYRLDDGDIEFRLDEIGKMPNPLPAQSLGVDTRELLPGTRLEKPAVTQLIDDSRFSPRTLVLWGVGSLFFILGLIVLVRNRGRS